MSDAIRLLVVDDEVDFVNTISERLSARDFEVTGVSSGPEAVEAARRGGFDLALVDLMMPEMDGIELLQILRESHQYLEVIILTAFGSIATAVECTRLGAFDYLSKPCSLDTLLEKLRAAYAKRLKTKFADDRQRYRKIEEIVESGPMALWQEAREDMKHRPSLLSVFRELRKLDDSKK
ncbi:MAG: response regulator [Acidobacteriota bacterium]|jgi:DNA-binding response OmpR family regulator